MLKKLCTTDRFIGWLMAVCSIVLLLSAKPSCAWTPSGLPSTKAEAASIGATCRSESVKHQFDVANGYPKGRKGYKVDHICALAKGGLDITANMQYQTTVDAAAKDRVENTLKGRLLYCNSSNSGLTRTVYNCK